MNEDLNDFLTACAATEKKKGNTSFLPEFLVHKELVLEALNRGWSVRTVWKALCEQGRFSGTYSAFASYVRRHLRKDADGRFVNA